MSRETNTRDVGLAIRDFIEGFYIAHFEDDEEVPNEDKIRFVDCCDPNNLVLHMDSGAQFTIRVVRTG
jgi:hypothetical protein